MSKPVEVIGDAMLADFSFAHLPPTLQYVSKPFCELARQIVASLPRCPERTVALRKLLEAKDAAVRCALPHNMNFPPVIVSPPAEWLEEYSMWSAHDE